MLTTAAWSAAAALLQLITGHAVQLSTEASALVHAWFASAYDSIEPCAHAYLREQVRMSSSRKHAYLRCFLLLRGV